MCVFWVEQRINDGDLLAIDRDDIEHLFKNEYGFTFGDRKRLWNTIQTFVCMNKIDSNSNLFYFQQSENTTNNIITIEQDDEVPVRKYNNI